MTLVHRTLSASGEFVEERNGRVCVLVDGEREWWTKASVDAVKPVDVSELTPEQAAELLRRLGHEAP